MSEARQVWFTVYRPTWGHGLFWLCLAGFALLLFSREPGHLLAPQLWAEDGVLWVAHGYDYGLVTLLQPRAGYLQTLSQLGGLVGIGLPFTAIPLFFALVAFVVQMAPAALLLSRRGAGLIASLPARLLLVAYYIGQPNSAEVYVNLTNAMWHLALLAFMLVVLPKPKTRFGLGLDIALLFLAGLSGPLALFIAPLAWWQARRGRGEAGGRERTAYAAVLSLCALAQGLLILASLGTERHGQLGVTLDRLFHIFADQIVLGGTIGGANVDLLLMQHWWLHTLPPALCCLAAVGLGIVAFIKGPDAYRQLVVLSALIMASALQSPMISEVMPQWDPMQRPGIGDRYYIIPMLAWFATLLVLAARPWAWGVGMWVGRALLCLCLVGIVADWQYLPYVPTGYYAAARTFDQAAPGTVVVFPINPVPWKFTLTKR